MYIEGLFDNVTLTSHSVTSQKSCQYNYMFDCSKTNGYNVPQDAVNEVRVFLIKYPYTMYFIGKKTTSLFFDRIMDFNRAEPTEPLFLTSVTAYKMQLLHTYYFALHKSEV